MIGFSLRKKAVGAYFNDAETISSVQVMKEHEHHPDQKLLDSVKSSRDVFFALYSPERRDPAVMKRLNAAIGAVRRDADRINRELREARK